MSLVDLTALPTEYVDGVYDVVNLGPNIAMIYFRVSGATGLHVPVPYFVLVRPKCSFHAESGIIKRAERQPDPLGGLPAPTAPARLRGH